jgi:hypothetical protein
MHFHCRLCRLCSIYWVLITSHILIFFPHHFNIEMAWPVPVWFSCKLLSSAACDQRTSICDTFITSSTTCIWGRH